MVIGSSFFVRVGSNRTYYITVNIVAINSHCSYLNSHSLCVLVSIAMYAGMYLSHPDCTLRNGYGYSPRRSDNGAP